MFLTYALAVLTSPQTSPVFEFYFTGFLNSIELYNILKTFDFNIIPRSWCNFVF